MSRRRSFLLWTVAFGLGAALFACFDLFHSTADLLTACEIDAATDGCTPEGGSASEAATDFCGWSSSQAKEYAQRACAWLGACETPMGGNAFGPCMFEALLAYDCAANPNHRAKARAHGLWDCLWKVHSCSEVDDCVFPKGVQGCGAGVSDYVACASAVGAAVNNLDVRVECVDGGAARGENCAFWGRTCASNGANAVCAGDRDAGFACMQPSCEGSPRTRLHWCEGGATAAGIDVGMDCAGNGAGTCAGFPEGNPQWVACIAESDAGAAASCTPAASAMCTDAGAAVSCPSGVREELDCVALLGSPSACHAGPLDPPFDWTSACLANPPQCASDSCVGATLAGCARGTVFPVDCNRPDVGLGPCRMVKTDLAQQEHAACSPP